MARVGVAGDSSSVALPSQDASAVDRRQMIYSLGIAGSAPNMNKHQGPSFFLAPDKTCARVAKVRTSIELFLTEVSANKRDPGLQQEVRRRPTFRTPSPCLPGSRVSAEIADRTDRPTKLSALKTKCGGQM